MFRLALTDGICQYLGKLTVGSPNLKNNSKGEKTLCLLWQFKRISHE